MLLGRRAEPPKLELLHVERLHDAVTTGGLGEQLGQVGHPLLRAMTGLAHPLAESNDGEEEQGCRDQAEQRQAKVGRQEQQNEEEQGGGLLEQVEDPRRDRTLHDVYVVDDAAHELGGGVTGVKAARLADDGAEQVVAHVGRHAQADVLERVATHEARQAPHEQHDEKQCGEVEDDIALVDGEPYLEALVTLVQPALEIDGAELLGQTASGIALRRVRNADHAAGATVREKDLREHRADHRNHRGRGETVGHDRG